MKLLKIFALLALLQAASKASHQHVRRLYRDAESIATSIDRLKMVARVAAGIQLTQDLITGTAKTTEMASELLKINPVTPTQIAALDTTALEAAITGLKNLKSAVTTQDNSVNDAKDNAIQFAKIKTEVQGIADFKSWPAKSNFATALTKVKTDGVDLSISQKIRAKATEWEMGYIQLRDADASDVMTYAKNVNKKTGELLALVNNPTIPQFSASESASQMFSVVSKIIDSTKLLKTLKPNVDKSKYTALSNMLSLFYTAGTQVSSTSLSISLIESLVTSRSSSDNSRRLVHTYGLFGGHADVTTVFADVQDQWMDKISQSSSLEEGIKVLKKIQSPALSFESKIGNSDPMDSRIFAGIRKLGEQIKDMSANSTGILGAFNNLANLQLGSAPQKFDEAKLVQGLVTDLDNLINPHTKAVSEAVTLLTTTLSDNLTALTTECAKAKDPGVDLMALQTKAKEFSDLHTKIVALRDSFPTTGNNAAIKAKAGEISPKLSSIDTFLQSMDGYSATFGTLKGTASLELLEDAFKNLDEFRNLANPPNYDRANTIIASIVASKSEMTSLKLALDGVKGKRSKESDDLDLLQNSKKTVESIGKAVKAVVTMDEVFRRRSDVQVVIQNIALVTSEIPNGFDPTDKATLSVLVNSKPQFTAMESSIATWHTAVKNVLLEKLTDGDNIFTPSTKVTGVSGDLAPMVTALEHLIEKVPASPNIANLKSLKNSLSTLSPLQLDFGSYQASLTSAGASMVLLDAFLSAFHREMSLRGAVSGNDKADGKEVSEKMAAKSDGFSMQDIIIIIICSIVVAVALIGSALGGIRYWLKKRQRPTLSMQINTAREGIDKYQLKGKEKEKSMKVVSKPAPGGKTKINSSQVPMDRITEFMRSLVQLVTVDDKKENVFFNKLRQVNNDIDLDTNEDVQASIFAKLSDDIIVGAQHYEEAMDKMDFVMDHRDCCRFLAPLVMETRVHAPVVLDGFFHGNLIEEEGVTPIIAFQSPLAPANYKMETRVSMYNIFRKQKVKHICMLSSFNTKPGDDECAEYFSTKEGGILKLAGMEVTTKAIQKDGDIDNYTIEVLYYSVNGTAEDVRIYEVHHYVTLPEHGAPATTEPFVKLLKKVDQSAEPIGVHCATGLGRTGVMCFAMAARNQLRTENVNISHLLSMLRKKRYGLIQTRLQLIFATLLTIDYALDGRKLDEEGLKMYKTLNNLYKVLLARAEGTATTPAEEENQKSTSKALTMKTTKTMKKNRPSQTEINELLELKEELNEKEKMLEFTKGLRERFPCVDRPPRKDRDIYPSWEELGLSSDSKSVEHTTKPPAVSASTKPPAVSASTKPPAVGTSTKTAKPVEPPKELNVEKTQPTISEKK